MRHLPSIATIISASPRAKRCEPRRRGVTLLEMIVVISVGAVILVSLMLTMTTLIRTERSVRTQAASQAQIVRLIHSWRTDVHQAQTVAGELAKPQSEIVLRHANGEFITYRFDPAAHAVLREVRRDGTIAGREAFVLPPKQSVSWRWRNADRSRSTWLVMEVGTPPQATQVVAVLDRWKIVFAANDREKSDD